MYADNLPRLTSREFLYAVGVLGAGLAVGFGSSSAYALIAVAALFILAVVVVLYALGFERGSIAVAGIYLFSAGILPWYLIGIENGRRIAFVGACLLLIVMRLAVDRRFSRQARSLWRPLLLMAPFTAMVMVSYTYTSAPHYGIQKMIVFVSILPIIAFFSAFIQRANHIRLLRKTVLIAAGLGIVSLLLNKHFIPIMGSRLGVEGTEGVLGLGRILGIGAFCAVTEYFFSRRSKIKSLLWLSLAGLFVFFTLQTGTRQAFFSFFIGIAVFLLLDFWGARRQKRPYMLKLLFLIMLSGLMVVSVGLGLVNLTQYSTGATRILSYSSEILMTPLRILSTAGRADIGLYSTAIDLFQKDPWLGGGLGSYATYYWGMDKRVYPHNMFLEVMSEMGILGLATLVLIIIVGLSGVFQLVRKRLTIQPEVAWLAGMWTITFVNAQFTGDFPSNFVFWVLTGLLLSLRAHLKADTADKVLFQAKESCDEQRL